MLVTTAYILLNTLLVYLVFFVFITHQEKKKLSLCTSKSTSRYLHGEQVLLQRRPLNSAAEEAREQICYGVRCTLNIAVLENPVPVNTKAGRLDNNCNSLPGHNQRLPQCLEVLFFTPHQKKKKKTLRVSLRTCEPVTD